MLCTISVGSHSLVQGIFVRRLSCGSTIVRIGDQLFKGMEVCSQKAA